MAKKPAWKPYFLRLVVKDWLTDTARLSLSGQGLWMRILCLMLLEPVRGVYERTIMEACRELGCTKEELLTHLSELSKFKPVRIDKDIIRVMSGRMQKDETLREKNAIYQYDHRRKEKVRGMSEKSNGQMLDVRRLDVKILDVNKDKETTKSKRIPFSIPSPEKIKEFIANNRLSVDAENFWNHYQSNGWRVGRNPMKDWQAALRTWQRNGINNGGLHGAPRSKSISEQVNERRRTQGLERVGENLTAREILDRLGNLPSV